MVEGKDKHGGEPRPGGDGHEEFLELCAFAASGNLSEEEQKKLQGHLSVCAECREAQKEFDAVVDRIIPEVVAENSPEAPAHSEFSQEAAETGFRKRLEEVESREQRGPEGDAWLSPLVVRRSRNFASHFDRYHLWLPMAAMILLFLALGVFSYHTGQNNGIKWGIAWARNEDRAKAPAEIVGATKEPPRPTVSSNDSELSARDAVLASLRREIAQKTSELDRLKARESGEQIALEAGASDKRKWNEERNGLLQEVSAREAALRETEERLKTLERERSQSVIHTASLEMKVEQLRSALDDEQRLTSEQQELLAKDHDIRELMGARELLVTDIYDVAKSGETQKAYGRLFYTKGKSLIFYAYDLDQSPGAREASTFEAWGRRGPDWSQAYKLGVFYEDNATKKRWVVKTNDRKTLAEIDAVFITVEPKGGSERPTGKPFLITYFKATPNHP